MRILVETDGAAVGIEGGRFVRPDDGRFDLTVSLAGGELRPGLINAHDHLHRNHYPRIGAPPYPDAYAWGLDLHDRFGDEIERARRLDRRDALLFGAFKNLLGGATTVVHHDPWEKSFDGAVEARRGGGGGGGGDSGDGRAGSGDRDGCGAGGGDREGGRNARAVHTRPATGRTGTVHNTFPVRIPRLRIAHSLGFERDLDAAVRGDARSRDRPLCLHLAEGVNGAAADEVRRVADLGLLDDRLLAVHVVGVDRDGVERLRAADAAVIWCPTSNGFLLGRTAPRALFDAGLDVLLGTDALLTGDGTLLDELRAARASGMLDDERLLDAVGALAARRLGLPSPSLEPGASADLVLLRRPLFGADLDDVACAEDVALVVVGGMPRFGDERFDEWFGRAGVAVENLRIGATTKLVAAPLATVAERVVELSPECGRILEA